MRATYKKKSPQRKLMIMISLIALLIALVASGFVYAYHQGLFSVSSSSETPSNGADPEATDGKADESPVVNPDNDQVNAGRDIKNDSLDEEEPANTDNTSVTVSASEQANGSVRVHTTINKVTNSGTCTLKVTKGSNVKTYSSTVQAVTNYSTCKGFTLSNLGTGTWTISLTYTNDTMTGTASTTIAL